MDYTPLVAYVISVISLALSIYTLYELNCSKDETPQKPSKLKPPAETQTRKTTPFKW